MAYAAITMEKESTSAMIWRLFDGLYEGILIAETDGTILYMNDAAGALLQLASDMPSLQAITPFLTTPVNWQDSSLLPFETTLTVDGRILNLRSQTIELDDAQLIQIIISPQPDTTDQLNSTEALQQLTALTPR